jgi:hypothetical protein
MPTKRAPRAPKDIAVLQGPTEDGAGARMLRFKEGSVFAGEVRPAREGQPLQEHELVRLRPLHPRYPVCEVEVLHTPAPTGDARRQGGGPARVSSHSYRRNWNAIFGAPTKKKPKRAGDWSVN